MNGNNLIDQLAEMMPCWGTEVNFLATVEANRVAIAIADPRRIRIVISSVWGTPTAGGQSIDVSIARGASHYYICSLTPELPTQVLTLEQYGPCIQETLFAIANGADTANVTAISTVVLR